MKRSIGVLAILMTQAGCSVFGIRTEENPKYEVLLRDGNKEIRQYSPYIIATTQVQGAFKDSMNSAFRILAAYIFGENEKNQSISMTAPVVAAPSSEKIRMTAPVMQAEVKDGWQMSFMMSSKYSMEDLPRPKNPRVKLMQVPSKIFAILRYSGTWTEEKNKDQADKLLKWLSKNGTYQQISGPVFAGYDPPWTLPFLRRNEVMIEVRESTQGK